MLDKINIEALIGSFAIVFFLYQKDKQLSSLIKSQGQEIDRLWGIINKK